MENHPIPQDVTGFKFRLIGSITLKQFLYLLGAGAIALVFYILPINPFVKFPLMGLSGLIGMAFAFVPIEGRPMDKMIYNFIKAIPTENQFIYHKKGAEMIFFSFVPPAHARPTTIQVQNQKASEKALLFQQFSKTYFKPDREEQENIQNISRLFQEGTASGQGFTNRIYNADTVHTSPSDTQRVGKTNTVTEKMAEPHMPQNNTPNEKVNPTTPFGKPANTQTVTDPSLQTGPNTNPVQNQPSAPQAANGVYTPNVIQGIVKDPRGKPLAHIVIEVLDANNIPVRAFRTTQNGSFKSVTPLPNGVYTIHLEDSLKKQNFSDVKIELKGEILAPVEITSIDQREQLRRELFGGQTINI